MNIESILNGIWRLSHPYKSDGNIWYFDLNGYLHYSGNSPQVAGVPWQISSDTLYVDFMSQQFLIVARQVDSNNLEGYVYKSKGGHFSEKFSAVKVGEHDPWFINDHFRKNGSSNWDLHCLGHGSLFVIKFASHSEARIYDKDEYDKELLEFPDDIPDISFQIGTYIISGFKLVIKLQDRPQHPLNFTYEYSNKYTGHIPIWENKQLRYYAGTLKEYQNLLIN